MRIIGNTVGTPLPKSNWKQTDPTKGDYIKNKPEVIDPSVGQLLAIKTIDEDGHISEFASVEVSMDEAKEYTDSKIVEFVGDTPVAEQISEAIDTIPQSDWNQNDETAKDYIKNRPFYEEEDAIHYLDSKYIKDMYYETDPIETILVNNLTSEDYYNENRPKCTFIPNQKYTVIFNGETYKDLVCYAGNGYNIIASEKNGCPFYIDDDGGLYISSDAEEFTVSIIQYKSEIYHIDPKYIKDMYYVGEELIETPFLWSEFELNEEYGEPMAWLESETGLITGKEYTVYLNGESYNLIAKPTGGSYGYLGNGSIIDKEVEDTGEPFVMISESSTELVISFHSDKVIWGWNNIEIFVKEPKIHKIDAKFLPDNFGVGRKGKGKGAEIFNAYGEENDTSTYAVRPPGAPCNHAKGDYSHAEGHNTNAIGFASHTEGAGTYAKGDYSHAEGWATMAFGEGSHAEGTDTSAKGECSHAEGWGAEASGYGSHAEGEQTFALGDYQHVQGRYNIQDKDEDGNPLSTYAHIVGNGINWKHLSNAHTLDWDGNAWFAGDVYVGSTSGVNKDEGSKKLATEEYVDNVAADLDVSNLNTRISDVETKVGDTSVADQITEAIAVKADKDHNHDGKYALENHNHDDKYDVKGSAATAEKNAKDYTDSEIAEWVGDKKVTTQISEAVSSKANTSDLTSHTGNTTAHITAIERANWNAAKSHAGSPHAPSGAQANVIESIKVNGTVQTITDKSVDITVPTDNKSLTNGAGYLVASDITNKADKATTLAGYGITDAAPKEHTHDYAVSSHTHDDKYYTESEIDTKFSNLVGDTAVPTQVSTALSSAKSYTDGEIAKLLNNSTEAVDSIYELRDAMEDNADAISALETIAGSKANASDLTAHVNNKSNPHGVTLGQLGVTATAAELNIMDGVTATTTELNYVDGVTSNIQTQLNAKVPTSRKVNGKALSDDITLSASDVGADASGAAASALTSAKSYTDAEITEWVGDKTVASQINTAVSGKANASDLTSHTGNTTVHITSAERTAWNAHADSEHAPSDAEPNQNAFSNVTVGSTNIAADSKTDTLTLAGSNVTITPDATNGKVTIGITKENVTDALGYTPPTTDTTYGAAGSSLGLVKSGGDVTIANGVITVNDDSHAHVISNVDGLQSALDAKATVSALSTLSGLVGDTAVSTQISNATANYYTKAQIDSYEFITIADIDAICGGSIHAASEVTY